MHNKLLLADGLIGITGGRNYQTDYHDWNPAFNYRDRDVLVTGPSVTEMEASFEAFFVSGASFFFGGLQGNRVKDIVLIHVVLNTQATT